MGTEIPSHTDSPEEVEASELGLPDSIKDLDFLVVKATLRHLEENFETIRFLRDLSNCQDSDVLRDCLRQTLSHLYPIAVLCHANPESAELNLRLRVANIIKSTSLVGKLQNFLDDDSCSDLRDDIGSLMGFVNEGSQSEEMKSRLSDWLIEKMRADDDLDMAIRVASRAVERAVEVVAEWKAEMESHSIASQSIADLVSGEAGEASDRFRSKLFDCITDRHDGLEGLSFGENREGG